MEPLKSDKSVILRFSEKKEVRIYWEDRLKQNFQTQDLSGAAMKEINEIICLGNKITKGYEDEKNNPINENKYNTNAKIVFEPWKEYKITESEFEKLKKVFWFVDGFFNLYKKIEFEFSCSQKIKMLDEPELSYEDYLAGDGKDNEKDKCQAIEKLLKDNSLEIETDKTDKKGNTDEEEMNDEKVITFQAKKKYYLTPDDINLLKKVFNITPYELRFLPPDCIYKNIFVLPLNILISFLDNIVCLNYQKYYFKDKQENNNQKNGIDDTLSRTLDAIKRCKQVNLDTAVKEINCIIKDYGFEEIKTKSGLADTCKNIVSKNKYTQENIHSILEKIKKALNQAILSKTLSILKSNLKERPIETNLMHIVETFLFSDLEDASDDLKETLGGKTVKLDKRREVLVKGEQNKLISKTIEREDSIKGLIENSKDIDSVLKSLQSLKETRMSICKACDFLISYSYEDEILGDRENTENAIKEIANGKSSSLSNEHIIAILNQLPEIAEPDGNTKDNEIQNKQLLINHINCIIETVKKYKLDIEDENPLKDVIRMFLDEKNNIERGVICNKINEMLKEQIYTEMLKKRPSLLLFVDSDFLYKKIILDQKENVFKTTFYNIKESVAKERFSIARYSNSFLNCLLRNENETVDVEKYCYDFTSFILDNISKNNNPFKNEVVPCFFACMLISKLSNSFIYKRIFPDSKNVNQKNPIKNLLDRLFENGQPSSYTRRLFYRLQDDEANILSNVCGDKIEIRQEYYKKHPFYWVIVAHVLSNLKYKPECKDNFLYFFDLFDWNEVDGNVWLGLFDFVDPSFLYRNLDVINRYLTFCKKYPHYSDLTEPKIEKICDYNNYSNYATEPKLSETDYFYTLLSYNEQCIKYAKPEFLLDRLKDERMKYCCPWIRDNAESKVKEIYEYIKNKKYDNTKQQQQNEDIFLLIKIFPDAMSKYIDAEFLIDNRNSLNPSFQEKCVDNYDSRDNFFDGIAKISDIKKKEKWYVYLLKMSKPGYFTNDNVIRIFVDNFDQFSDESVKACIELYKDNEEDGCLLTNLFNRVNTWDLKNGARIKSKPKAEKTLWLIKTFGAKKAIEHVDKEFLIRNLNDEDTGNTIKKCIKLCAEEDMKSNIWFSEHHFCRSLYETVMDNKSGLYSNDEQKKIIFNLIDICKEKIFEHVDNQFLLENLDNEIIKDVIAYASNLKLKSILECVDALNCSENDKINMYVKLMQCNPYVFERLLRCTRSINQNPLTSSPQARKAVNQIILSKDIGVLSFLNNCQETAYSFFCYVQGIEYTDERTQIIKALSCLDFPLLKKQLRNNKYMLRNLACIKYNLDNNDLFLCLPFENVTLASNLFKIHNQLNCNLNLVDLVSENRRLCCETIDSYLPEYENLSKIIKSSYEKYLWFIGISFLIFLAIFISGFCVEFLAVNFVRYVSIILCYLLMLDGMDAIEDRSFTVFKKIFLPLSLKKYETRIKHEEEARYAFYSSLKDKFDFEKYVYVYDNVVNIIKEKNIDIRKDFFDWLKTTKKKANFNKESTRETKINFVFDFILRLLNDEIMKKLDGETGKLEDFSNDNKAISLLDNWLNENPNYNDCRGVLQSEFLDMIKFKDGELKIKLKRKDNIKILAEKIYDQIIDPQDKNLDLQNEKENEKKEEINTSEENVIINNNQSENNNLVPLLKISSENQRGN